jgi:hypothetical protein
MKRPKWLDATFIAKESAKGALGALGAIAVYAIVIWIAVSNVLSGSNRDTLRRAVTMRTGALTAATSQGSSKGASQGSSQSDYMLMGR